MEEHTNIPVQVHRHYFYDELSHYVYYTEKFPEDLNGMIHLGDSDNPKPVSAVAGLLKGQKVSSGYSIRNLDDQ